VFSLRKKIKQSELPLSRNFCAHISKTAQRKLKVTHCKVVIKDDELTEVLMVHHCLVSLLYWYPVRRNESAGYPVVRFYTLFLRCKLHRILSMIHFVLEFQYPVLLVSVFSTMLLR